MPGHESDTCSNPKSCYNCKGNHDAFSKQCPNWIKEKEIIAIKTLNKISYSQAKQQFEQKNNNWKNTTYAQAVNSNGNEPIQNPTQITTKTIGTDTDLDKEWLEKALKKENHSLNSRIIIIPTKKKTMFTSVTSSSTSSKKEGKNQSQKPY